MYTDKILFTVDRLCDYTDKLVFQYNKINHWSQKKKDKYIQSLLSNFPQTPIIIFAEQGGAVRKVLDGESRLLTIQEYREELKELYIEIHEVRGDRKEIASWVSYLNEPGNYKDYKKNRFILEEKKEKKPVINVYLETLNKGDD